MTEQLTEEIKFLSHIKNVSTGYANGEIEIHLKQVRSEQIKFDEISSDLIECRTKYYQEIEHLHNTILHDQTYNQSMFIGLDAAHIINKIKSPKFRMDTCQLFLKMTQFGYKVDILRINIDMKEGNLKNLKMAETRFNARFETLINRYGNLQYPDFCNKCLALKEKLKTSFLKDFDFDFEFGLMKAKVQDLTTKVKDIEKSVARKFLKLQTSLHK